MEKDSKIDILTALSQYNLEHLVFEIFNHLSALDLKCCQLVSSTWNFYVESLLDRLNERWEKGQPSVSKFQCDKQRSSFSDHMLQRPQKSVLGVNCNTKYSRVLTYSVTLSISKLLSNPYHLVTQNVNDFKSHKCEGILWLCSPLYAFLNYVIGSILAKPLACDHVCV